MRLAAEIVSVSVASNSGARPPRRLGLGDLSARRARAVGVGLTCFVPGIGSGDAAEAVRHGDVHRDDRDAAGDIGLLRERAGDGQREICGRGDDGRWPRLARACRSRGLTGEAGGRVEPHVAGRRDRPAVGRRAAAADRCGSYRRSRRERR